MLIVIMTSGRDQTISLLTSNNFISPTSSVSLPRNPRVLTSNNFIPHILSPEIPSSKHIKITQPTDCYRETELKMGCAGSLPAKRNRSNLKARARNKYWYYSLTIAALSGTVKTIRKPKPWKFPQPITKSQLMQMRDEFWDTAPHYGGKKEIWDALHAAAEADITLAQAIVDSAGVIVHKPDLTVCYDERGSKYELPKYVLSEPYNLIRES